MDAFFASIEQRDNPELRGKPVIVGALPGNRGVVSAASYEARKYGIHSALPISQAYARCPHGFFVRPRMQVYSQVSKEVIAILRTFTPRIEQISIDEAFMDMSGTEKLWGNPVPAAETLKEKIRNVLDLTASIGIAPNKFLAKLASDMHKPDGITEAPFKPEAVISWLAPLEVSRIWGVGKKTQLALFDLGIRSIGDLQKLSGRELEKRFGKQGLSLYNLCRGIDSRVLEEPGKAKSISREHTFNTDSFDRDEWRRVILTLARDVARRARKAQQKGRTICLTFRTPDFKRHTRQATVEHATHLAKQIYEQSCVLLEKELPRLKSLRLIGVGITNFEDTLQTELFDDEKKIKIWNASEQAMDVIAERFGSDAIFRAREMHKKKAKRLKR